MRPIGQPHCIATVLGCYNVAGNQIEVDYCAWCAKSLDDCRLERCHLLRHFQPFLSACAAGRGAPGVNCCPQKGRVVVWTCECLAYFVNFYNVSVKQLRYGVVVWVRLSQGGCHLIAIFFNCLHLEFIDSLVHFRHPHDR